jgi:CMP-N,N'-diacetyllegionaminic acid synthase
MKILGLIPARGGSKGVPKKNIKMLGDKSLIAYTIESAQQSQKIHTIIVSTDSDDIFHAAEKLGLKPPFFRPDTLSLDTSTSLEVVQHIFRCGLLAAAYESIP